VVLEGEDLLRRASAKLALQLVLVVAGLLDCGQNSSRVIR
jgi:hypothetical protein